MSKVYFAPLQSHHQTDNYQKISRVVADTDDDFENISTQNSYHMGNSPYDLLQKVNNMLCVNRMQPHINFTSEQEKSLALEIEDQTGIDFYDGESIEVKSHDEHESLAVLKSLTFTPPQASTVTPPPKLRRENALFKYVLQENAYKTQISSIPEYTPIVGYGSSIGCRFDFTQNSISTNLFVEGVARQRWVDKFHTALFLDANATCVFSTQDTGHYTVALLVTECSRKGSGVLITGFNDSVQQKTSAAALLSVEDHKLFLLGNEVGSLSKTDHSLALDSKMVFSPRRGVVYTLFIDGQDCPSIFVPCEEEEVGYSYFAIGSTKNAEPLPIGFQEVLIGNYSESSLRSPHSMFQSSFQSTDSFRIKCLRDRLFLALFYQTPVPVYKATLTNFRRLLYIDLAIHVYPSLIKSLLPSNDHKFIVDVMHAMDKPELSEAQRRILPVGGVVAYSISGFTFLYHKISATHANVLVICTDPSSHASVLPEFPMKNGKTKFGYTLPVFNVNITELFSDKFLVPGNVYSDNFSVSFEAFTGINYEDYRIAMQQWTPEQLKWVFTTELLSDTSNAYPAALFCGMDQEQSMVVNWIVSLGMISAATIDLHVTQLLHTSERASMTKKLDQWIALSHRLIKEEVLDESVSALVDHVCAKWRTAASSFADVVTWDHSVVDTYVELTPVPSTSLSFHNAQNVTLPTFAKDAEVQRFDEAKPEFDLLDIPTEITTAMHVQQLFTRLIDVCVSDDSFTMPGPRQTRPSNHKSLSTLIPALFNPVLAPRHDGKDVYATLSCAAEAEELLNTVVILNKRLLCVCQGSDNISTVEALVFTWLFVAINDRVSLISFPDSHPALVVYQNSPYRLTESLFAQQTAFVAWAIPEYVLLRSLILSYFSGRSTHKPEFQLMSGEQPHASLKGLMNAVSKSMNTPCDKLGSAFLPLSNALLPYFIGIMSPNRREQGEIHTWDLSVVNGRVKLSGTIRDSIRSKDLVPRPFLCISDPTTPEAVMQPYFTDFHSKQRVCPSPPAMATEDDIIYFTQMNVFKQDFGSEREAEQLLLYLSQPYTRIPLLLDFFTETRDRFALLVKKETMQLLKDAILMPGQFAAEEEALVVPNKSATTTLHGYLINEMIHAPKVVLALVIKLLDLALLHDTGIAFSPFAQLVVDIIGLVNQVFQYSQLVLRNSEFYAVSDTNIQVLQVLSAQLREKLSTSARNSQYSWVIAQFKLVREADDKDKLTAVIAQDEANTIECVLLGLTNMNTDDSELLNAVGMEEYVTEENTTLINSPDAITEDVYADKAFSAVLQMIKEETKTAIVSSLMSCHSLNHPTRESLDYQCKQLYCILVQLPHIDNCDDLELAEWMGMFLCLFDQDDVDSEFELVYYQLGQRRAEIVSRLEKASVSVRSQILTHALHIKSCDQVVGQATELLPSVTQWSRVTGQQGRYCEIATTTDSVLLSHARNHRMFDAQTLRKSGETADTYSPEEYQMAVYAKRILSTDSVGRYVTQNDLRSENESKGVTFDFYDYSKEKDSEFYCSMTHALATHPIFSKYTVNMNYADERIEWVMYIIGELISEFRGVLFFLELTGSEQYTSVLYIEYSSGKISKAQVLYLDRARKYGEVYDLTLVWNNVLFSVFNTSNNAVLALANETMRCEYDRVFVNAPEVCHDVRMMCSIGYNKNLSSCAEVVFPQHAFDGVLPLYLMELFYFVYNEKKQIIGYPFDASSNPFKLLLSFEGTTITQVTRCALNTAELKRMDLEADKLSDFKFVDQQLHLVNIHSVTGDNTGIAKLCKVLLRLHTLGNTLIWVDATGAIQLVESPLYQFVRVGDRLVFSSSPSHFLSLGAPADAEKEFLTKFPHMVLLHSDEGRSICISNFNALPVDCCELLQMVDDNINIYEVHEASFLLTPTTPDSTRALFFYYLYLGEQHRAVTLVHTLPTDEAAFGYISQDAVPTEYIGALLMSLNHSSQSLFKTFAYLAKYVCSGHIEGGYVIPHAVELSLLRKFISRPLMSIVRSMLYSVKRSRVIMTIAILYNRCCFLESLMTHQTKATYLPLTAYRQFVPYQNSRRYVRKHFARYMADMTNFLHTEKVNDMLTLRTTLKTDLLPYHVTGMVRNTVIELPHFKEMLEEFPLHNYIPTMSVCNGYFCNALGSLLWNSANSVFNVETCHVNLKKGFKYVNSWKFADTCSILNSTSVEIFRSPLRKVSVRTLAKRIQLGLVMGSEYSEQQYSPNVFLLHLLTLVPELAQFMPDEYQDATDTVCMGSAIALYLHYNTPVFEQIMAVEPRASVYKQAPTVYSIDLEKDSETKVRDMALNKRFALQDNVWISPLACFSVDKYVRKYTTALHGSDEVSMNHPTAKDSDQVRRLDKDVQQQSKEQEVIELVSFEKSAVEKACNGDNVVLQRLRSTTKDLLSMFTSHLKETRAALHSLIQKAIMAVHHQQERSACSNVSFEYLLACLTSTKGVFDIMKRVPTCSAKDASAALQCTALAAAVGCRCSLIWRTVRSLIALSKRLHDPVLDASTVHIQAVEVAALLMTKRRYITQEPFSSISLPADEVNTRVESDVVCPVFDKDNFAVQVVKIAKRRGDSSVYDFFTSDASPYKYEDTVKWSHYREVEDFDTSNVICYDPRFLVFEFLSGIILRTDQLETTQAFYNALVTGNSRTQQLLMGAGKTTVVMPLLAILLFRQPTVLVVPASLLSFTKDAITTAFASTFSISQYTFDFNRNSVPLLELFRNLHYHTHTGGVITTVPASLQSLLLKSIEIDKQLSNTLEYRDCVLPVRSFLLHALLRFFRTCHVLVDEVDTVLHPLRSEMNFPIGLKAPLALAPSRWDLALHLLHPLVFYRNGQVPEQFSHSPKARKLLEDIATAIENALSTGEVQMQPHVVVTYKPYYTDILRPLFAKWAYFYMYSYGNVHMKEAEFLNYLLSNSQSTMDTENARHNELSALAKTWLDSYLPHLLGKVNRVHYGVLNNTDLLSMAAVEPYMPLSRLAQAIPFVALDTPSRASEFAHPDMLIGYTFLAYVYQGMRYRDFCSLVSELHKLAAKEVGNFYSRSTVIMFDAWLKSSTCKKDISLDVLVPANAKDMHDVYVALRSHSAVIAWFLSNLVYPQYTKQQALKLTCAAADMPLLAAQTAGFSGTPSNVLPTKMGLCSYQSGAEAEMYSVLNNPAIVSTQVLDLHWNAKKILSTVATAVNDDGTPKYQCLIDSGALITDLTQQQVANYLLTHGLEWAEGVVFTDDAGKVLVLQRGKKDPVDLHVSGIALNKRFTFYDQAHSTGVDVRQTPTAHAAVTVSSHIIWRDYAQAAYRLRNIKNGQTMTVFVPPTAYLLLVERLLQDRKGRIDVNKADVGDALLHVKNNIKDMLRGMFVLFVVNAATQEALQKFQMERLNQQYELKDEAMKLVYLDHAYTYRNMPVSSDVAAKLKQERAEKDALKLKQVIAKASAKKNKLHRKKISEEYKCELRRTKQIEQTCLTLEDLLFAMSEVNDAKSADVSAIKDFVDRYVVYTDSSVGSSTDTHALDMEITTEMEQAKLKLVEEQHQQQVVEYTYSITNITKNNANETIWTLEELESEEDLKKSLAIYPLKNMKLQGNSQTQLELPASMLVTNNVYERHARGARKLGSVQYLLEWSPLADKTAFSDYDVKSVDKQTHVSSSPVTDQILQGHTATPAGHGRYYLYLSTSEGNTMRAFLHRGLLPKKCSFCLYTIGAGGAVVAKEQTANHVADTHSQLQQIAFLQWVNGLQSLSQLDAVRVQALLERTSPASRCAFYLVAAACKRRDIVLPLHTRRNLMYTLQYTDRAEVHAALTLAEVIYSYLQRKSLTLLDLLRVLDGNVDGMFTAGNLHSFFSQLDVPATVQDIACLLYAQGKFVGGFSDLSAMTNSAAELVDSCSKEEEAKLPENTVAVETCIEDENIDKSVSELIASHQRWMLDASQLVRTFETIVITETTIAVETANNATKEALEPTADVVVVTELKDEMGEGENEVHVDDTSAVTYNQYGWRVYNGKCVNPLPYFSDITVYDVTKEQGTNLSVVGPYSFKQSANGSTYLNLPPGSYIRTEGIRASVSQGNVLFVAKVSDATFKPLQGVHPLLALQHKQRGIYAINDTRTLFACPDKGVHYDCKVLKKQIEMGPNNLMPINIPNNWAVISFAWTYSPDSGKVMNIKIGDSVRTLSNNQIEFNLPDLTKPVFVGGDDLHTAPNSGNLGIKYVVQAGKEIPTRVTSRFVQALQLADSWVCDCCARLNVDITDTRQRCLSCRYYKAPQSFYTGTIVCPACQLVGTTNLCTLCSGPTIADDELQQWREQMLKAELNKIKEHRKARGIKASNYWGPNSTAVWTTESNDEHLDAMVVHLRQLMHDAKPDIVYKIRTERETDNKKKKEEGLSRFVSRLLWLKEYGVEAL